MSVVMVVEVTVLVMMVVEGDGDSGSDGDVVTEVMIDTLIEWSVTVIKHTKLDIPR